MKNNNIAETSLIAFEEIKPKTNALHERVLSCIDICEECTARQISEWAGMYHATVVARLNELVYKHQLLKVVGTRNNQSLYDRRKETDPLNVMKPTPLQKLKMLRAWVSSKGLYIPTGDILKKIDEYLK